LEGLSQVIRVDEQVSVSVNSSGEPIGFQWRNNSYLVLSKPIRWFARKQWWIEAARAQRGIGSGVLEVEMWRLSASKPQETPAQFELIHQAEKNNWQLVRVFS
jgi:hypothetical protein